MQIQKWFSITTVRERALCWAAFLVGRHLLCSWYKNIAAICYLAELFYPVRDMCHVMVNLSGAGREISGIPPTTRWTGMPVGAQFSCLTEACDWDIFRSLLDNDNIERVIVLLLFFQNWICPNDYYAWIDFFSCIHLGKFLASFFFFFL